MTDRRLATRPSGADGEEDAGVRHHHHTAFPSVADRRAQRPRSAEEAEERYVAARDAWTAAMRGAQSGASADLAALAIAQEAYEAALAEKARWTSARVAIPVEHDSSSDLDAVVGQELSWRRVHEHEQEAERKPRGALGGLLRRLRGR
jgi:hypothetical protein